MGPETIDELPRALAAPERGDEPLLTDKVLEKELETRRMIYPVVKYGDDVLATKAEPVTQFDSELEKLLEDMFESMYAANGVGLAAPQIGISRRIAVIDCSCGKDPKAKIVLINPEIISTDGEQLEEEGCLSVPGFREMVTRPARATVRAFDAKGKAVHHGRGRVAGQGLLP